jgi:hypothetical protein
MMVCVYQVLMARIVYLTPLGVASLLALLMVQKDIQPLLSIFGLVFYCHYPRIKLSVAYIFLDLSAILYFFAVLDFKLNFYLFLLFKFFCWIMDTQGEEKKISK